MAYYTDPRRDEDEQEEGQSQAQNPQLNAGSQTIGEEGAQTAQNTSGGVQPRSSGMLVNIRKYLDANKPQAEKMGNAISDKAGKESENLNQQIDARRGALENFLGGSGGRIAQIQQAKQYGENLLANAGQQQPTAEDVKKFNQIRNNELGYDNIPEINLAEQELRAKRLADRAKLESSVNANKDVLQSTFGGSVNPYSRGMRTLDQLTLQTNPQVLNQVAQKLKDQSQQVGQNLEQSKRTAFDLTQQAKDLNQQTTTGLNTGLENAQTQLRTDVENQAKQFDTDLAAFNKQLASELSQGFISRAMYDKLDPNARKAVDQIIANKQSTTDFRYGLRGESPTQGLNPALLGQDGFSETELSRVASDQQIARQRALELLAGKQPEFLTQENRDLQFSPEEMNMRKLLENLAARQTSYNSLRDEQARAAAEAAHQQAYQDYGQSIGAGNIFNQGAVEAFAPYSRENLADSLMADKSFLEAIGKEGYGSAIQGTADKYEQARQKLRMIRDLYNRNPLTIREN